MSSMRHVLNRLRNDPFVYRADIVTKSGVKCVKCVIKDPAGTRTVYYNGKGDLIK